METTVGAIAGLIGGEVGAGDPEKLISGFSALEDADPSKISFYASEKFENALMETSAGAVIVSRSLEGAPVPKGVTTVFVDDAAGAFDAIVAEYGRRPLEFEVGVSDNAAVDGSASFDRGAVSILAGAVVSRRVVLGRGTRIQSGAVIGEDVVIGEDCDIGPNVTIREGCELGDRVVIHAGSVIGADGFGYEFEEGRHRKVDQRGIVRVESDVEVGACTTIDRARFGETVIGEGTKIDNLVQIGHNAIIGKHCIIVAQCGISGSAKIGNYVTLAARVGIAGHIEIADRVTVGGKSGVIASIKEPGGTYFGYPAKPMKETLRNKMHLKRLGSLFERVKELEKKLEALDESE